MAIGQQPTDLINKHPSRNRSGFGDPSGWNQPRKGGPTTPPEAITPPGIALTGAYHGEGRAIEKCMQKGKICAEIAWK
jgi:hypothetical protein